MVQLLTHVLQYLHYAGVGDPSWAMEWRAQYKAARRAFLCPTCRGSAMKLVECGNRDESNTPFYMNGSVNMMVEWPVKNAKKCAERIGTNPVMDLMIMLRDEWEMYKQWKADGMIMH